MPIRIIGAVLSDAGTDEPDGSDDDVRTVTFGFRGVVYEVELDAQDRAALEAVFERYLRIATVVGTCQEDPGLT